MTLIATLAVALPLFTLTNAFSGGSDIEVYKDQLKEIDVDAQRGLVSHEEAKNARNEIGLRILKADTANADTIHTEGRPFVRVVIIATALAVPVFSWSFYLNSGKPEMPGQPIVSRGNGPAEVASVEMLLAKAEAHLLQNPTDGKGWSVTAPIYLRLGRFDAAINAYKSAIQLNGATFEYEMGLGEAYTRKNSGKIDNLAREAFQKASEIEPDAPEPRVALARDFAQKGDFQAAKNILEELLKTAPAQAEWRETVVSTITQLSTAAQQAKPIEQGPTQQDVENAANLSDADRTQMIEGMVRQFDAKLNIDPLNVEGWKKLLRAYVVLGQQNKIQDTLKRARLGLKNDTVGLLAIDALANELGI